ncbi:preprotein translocase, SecY subunit [Peptostreptococcaceae bacterium AS15]|nr:preprotein translocase, SecY subunit [Peptostreptococcaceae bacterium AS15]
MFSAVKNAFKIPDLKKKLVYTILMLAVFRVGSAVPVPGINVEVIKNMLQQYSSFSSFYDLVSGGALNNFTIFALGVGPYVTSSIIIQLLAVAIPSLEDMQKSGEEGRKKIMQLTRYVTVGLALLQSTALAIGFFNSALISHSRLNELSVVLTLTAGSAFLMWLGEQITEKGIGNGISIIIFAGIVSRIPGGAIKSYEMLKTGQLNLIEFIVFLAVSLAIIAGVIMVLEATRKVPVQHAKRVVGRKTYGGQTTHIPIKINQAGVIPVIFASSFLMMPNLIGMFVKNPGYTEFVNKYFNTQGTPGLYVYAGLEFLLVLGFTYFYVSIIFKPDEIADNLKNSGGFIPGIRPGYATAEYLDTISNRLTLAGGVFLALISAVPLLIIGFTSIPFRFGGTSLLIVVGVALDTLKQIEAQMVMRHYQGFLS